MGESGGGPAASVVIPAHDEEAVIGRCLATLLDDAANGELEVVVVANGCSDRTAEVARTFAPSVRVIEIPIASKTAALNAGDLVATTFPRLYVDADVEISSASVRCVLETLGATTFCSAPRMVADLRGTSWFARWFNQAYASLPYMADDLVGGGVYALTEVGRRRFDTFPDLTADDLFVRNLFSDEERRTAPCGEFVVRPPRTLQGLLAVRRRTYRGNAEYEQLGYRSAARSTFDRRRIVRQFLRHPLEMSVYVAVNLVAKLQLRVGWSTGGWERDHSSRLSD